MKSKDIKVGDEYATRPRSHHYEHQRVEVLEVGAERAYSSRCGFHRYKANDGVRVAYKDTDTGEPKEHRYKYMYPTTLLPKDILKPWPDFVPELLEARRLERERRRQADAKKQVAEERMAELQAFGVKSAKCCGVTRRLQADAVECLDVMRAQARTIKELRGQLPDYGMD